MERLYQRLKNRDFVMLAVSEDDDGRASVQRFVDEMHLTFPVLTDPDGVVPGRYGVTGYPETFVIDRDGRVIQHTIGPEDWESDRSYQFFTRLLETSSGATQASAAGRLGS